MLTMAMCCSSFEQFGLAIGTDASFFLRFTFLRDRFIGCMVYCGLHRRVTSITSDPYLNDFALYSTDIIVIFSAVFINKWFVSWPRGYKTFLMLNSTEHEISSAHKTKIPTKKEVSCFKSLRCCIYHANKR